MDQTVSAKRVKRPFLAPAFVKTMLAGHSALGLAFAWLIYVACLTGTLSVFLFELQRWEQPNAPMVYGPLSPEVIKAAVDNGYAQSVADNAAHDIFILGPVNGPRLLVSYHDHETGVEGNWIADASGRLATRVKAPWSDFVAKMHMQLHLPRTWGMFLVGLTGVALLSSLISGLLSHPRIFKDAFALRWGGSRRLQEADLHNRLGAWGLPFHVVVSLTGALLGLSTLIVGVLALAAYEGDSGKAFATLLGPRASEEETAAPVADVAAMIRHVQAEKPDAVFSSISLQHVGKAGQVVHLAMRTPGHLAFGNSYYFDGNGRALGDGGLETGSIGQQILGVLQPLHFGWFGGITIKLLYGLLGLALTVITHSGVVIWLARRRDKGRPAPLWEKIWPGAAWGQPVALACAAIAALTLSQATILPIYLATVVLTIALASLLSSTTAIRTLRLLSALTIAGAVGTHIKVWGVTSNDPMGVAANVGLIMCAAVILAPAIRLRTLPRRETCAASRLRSGRDPSTGRESPPVLDQDVE